jgi:hypothetical protein
MSPFFICSNFPLAQARDEGSKTNLQAMITELKDGQNVN